MFDECRDEYIFSGSLPENASTYVKREADDQLYEALQQGKFCYVLNSRQSGKSSLRLRTMSRLYKDGVECAAIDLSSINIQGATQENWYADLITILINSFVLDINLKDWWEQNQLNSPLMRFTNFIEKHLLVEIEEPVVIFIDEIDSVLSLNFPTDDFFAFIRACYNQRVDNPKYNRLTFCLLGVASPSNLIQDKQRTPFNIGKAISLKGFRLDEAEPLERGLRGKFSDSQSVIQQILDWTGGQPFLTQKLCQFMLEESEKEKPRTVEQVVKSRIIESWESQDEPEHLRTIRARILRNEERAGYLLELYQQIRLNEIETSITADNTIEQSELLLSGLVARREGQLRVYNGIYQEVFNQSWVENELNNLRPYSESFKSWVNSGAKDESRLLRGKALVDAEEWSENKNLSYQDRQFLAASREKEIQEKIVIDEQEAKLERERKDREATEQRNQVLSEANNKAKQRIRNGTIVLAVTLLGATISGILAWNKVNQANIRHKNTETEVETVQKLSQLAGQLRNKSFTFNESNEILRQAGLAFRINDHNLKQAMLLASMSQVYQRLGQQEKAEQKMTESLKYLNNKKDGMISSEGLQTTILVKITQGHLVSNKYKKQAIKIYREAFNLLKNYPNETNPLKENQILTSEDVELVHTALLELLADENKSVYRQEIRDSLKGYLFTELEYLLKERNWREADKKTWQLILVIANREKEASLNIQKINKLSCSELNKIDGLWIKNSDGKFGFGVQKKIWMQTGNRLGIKPSDWNKNDIENYHRFATAVGWYNRKGEVSQFLYPEDMSGSNKNQSIKRKGALPLPWIYFNSFGIKSYNEVGYTGHEILGNAKKYRKVVVYEATGKLAFQKTSKTPYVASFVPLLFTKCNRPEEAVVKYYQLINKRQYSSSWAMLSSRFKRLSPDSNYNNYQEWWDKVASTRIDSTRLIKTSNDYAFVDVRLKYFLKDGRQFDDPSRIALVLDSNGKWLIDNKRILRD